jgi:hypothetical protein
MTNGGKRPSDPKKGNSAENPIFISGPAPRGRRYRRHRSGDFEGLDHLSALGRTSGLFTAGDLIFRTFFGPFAGEPPAWVSGYGNSITKGNG